MDYEPRLDPNEWNKHFNQRKSLRFALRDPQDGQSQHLEPETRGNDAWDSLRYLNADKSSLKKFLKKYSSTTMDPMDLIRFQNMHLNERVRCKTFTFRKYQSRRSDKSTTTVSPVRRYPPKIYVGKLASEKEEEEEEDLYSKYTTASTFRNKNIDRTDNSDDTEASSKEIEPAKKYFNADAIEIKVPRLRPGGTSKNFLDKGK